MARLARGGREYFAVPIHHPERSLAGIAIGGGRIPTPKRNVEWSSGDGGVARACLGGKGAGRVLSEIASYVN